MNLYEDYLINKDMYCDLLIKALGPYAENKEEAISAFQGLITPSGSMRSDNLNVLNKKLGFIGLDKFLTSCGIASANIVHKHKTYVCPKCNSKKAYIKEFHPDTSMNNFALYCPDCRYSEDTEALG
jgi:hypothetical protein